MMDGLPKGTTHISRIKFHASSGGWLNASVHAFKYSKSGELLVYTTDGENEYPSWANAADKFYKIPELVSLSELR